MPTPKAPLPPILEPAVEYRWGLYAVSFLVPFAGIIIALFLIESDPKAVRRVGRICLLTGFLVWVLFPAMVAAGILLALFVSVLGFLSEFMQMV